MDALKSLVQPLVGSAGGSSVVDGMKLVILGGTVETARRVSSSAWSHFVNSFFLTAHFSEEDYPYDWLMLWLSRRPEWQRSREFETTTRTSTPGSYSATSSKADGSFGDGDFDNDGTDDNDDNWIPGKAKTRVVFQPTFDTTHTIYYRGHWLRVKRGRKGDGSGCEVLSISVVARNNTILKQLVLQAKREYEAESIHRIQIYFADSHGSWRWTDSRQKRPMGSIVLNPGVKEMLLSDTRDFLRSEKWYADRGIPFRRGYLLHGVPGSGKSSLIHAIAGELMLDIYVVSLSSSWISDSTLQTLMGRVPARCILLLEDLDAAFTRSTSRDDNSTGSPESNSTSPTSASSSTFTSSSSSSSSSRRRHRSSGSNGNTNQNLNDMNTLSLSGLLNALDGVAAAEGRILFATTNHLERLDPALSRPGRMDVWIEFKNASKWQAEALFRNFFPCADEREDGCTPETADQDGKDTEKTIAMNIEDDDDELSNVDLGTLEVCKLDSEDAHSEMSSVVSEGPHTPSTLTSISPSLWPSFNRPSSWISSSASSAASTPSSGTRANSIDARSASPRSQANNIKKYSQQFGANNQAYLAPPVEEQIARSQHSAKPLDAKILNKLAKKFADSIPEEEFSVASLQGYLLKNKSQPEAAADGAVEWVVSERTMRERLKKEKEARELKEKLERERRRKELQAKEKKSDLEKKEREIEKMKQELEEQKRKDKEREEREKKLLSGRELAEKDDETMAYPPQSTEVTQVKEDEAEDVVVVKLEKEVEEASEDEHGDNDEDTGGSDEENIPPPQPSNGFN